MYGIVEIEVFHTAIIFQRQSMSDIFQLSLTTKPPLYTILLHDTKVGTL